MKTFLKLNYGYYNVFEIISTHVSKQLLFEINVQCT